MSTLLQFNAQLNVAWRCLFVDCSVMMVDGDHRVGLYAEQDLEAGDELFYNYM